MAGSRWVPTRPRGPVAAEFQTPGPGTNTLPSTIGRESPAFTIAGRHDARPLHPTPAPNEYNTRKLTNKGKDAAPARSMAGRARARRPEVTPAPGDYTIKTRAITSSSPRYSFGHRLDQKRPGSAPAPNAYSVRELLGDAPRYTIQGRGRDPADERAQFPAPGQYTGEATALKPRSPAYSLRQRTAVPADRTLKPGPAAYSVQDRNLTRRQPQFSFGIKHSPYEGKFRTSAGEES